LPGRHRDPGCVIGARNAVRISNKARPLGPSWELDRNETDAEGCIFVQLSQKLTS
jgi:hypothetical protein